MIVVPARPTTATRRDRIDVAGGVQGKLDLAPQRVVCGEGDRQATRLVGGDEFGCAPLDDLELIGAGGDRRATPSAQVLDHLALRRARARPRRRVRR